jgi:hypothetical protein
MVFCWVIVCCKKGDPEFIIIDFNYISNKINQYIALFLFWFVEAILT